MSKSPKTPKETTKESQKAEPYRGHVVAPYTFAKKAEDLTVSLPALWDERLVSVQSVQFLTPIRSGTDHKFEDQVCQSYEDGQLTVSIDTAAIKKPLVTFRLAPVDGAGRQLRITQPGEFPSSTHKLIIPYGALLLHSRENDSQVLVSFRKPDRLKSFIAVAPGLMHTSIPPGLLKIVDEIGSDRIKASEIELVVAKMKVKPVRNNDGDFVVDTKELTDGFVDMIVVRPQVGVAGNKKDGYSFSLVFEHSPNYEALAATVTKMGEGLASKWAELRDLFFTKNVKLEDVSELRPDLMGEPSHDKFAQQCANLRKIAGEFSDNEKTGNGKPISKKTVTDSLEAYLQILSVYRTRDLIARSLHSGMRLEFGRFEYEAASVRAETSTRTSPSELTPNQIHRIELFVIEPGSSRE